jgi:hypothetical protein
MTILVTLETVVLLILTVLVAGLLRAYGTVLRRLHELAPPGPTPQDFGLPDERRLRSEQWAEPLPAPDTRGEWSAAHDLSGESVTGEIITARVVGSDRDAVLLFLSSTCASCEDFWTELAQRDMRRLPPSIRLVIVTQGPEAESRAAIAALAPAGIDVIMSTQAWQEYEVPGSPHVVFVEGSTGRVRGEGTGQSWMQLRGMLERAGSDSSTGLPTSRRDGTDKSRRDGTDKSRRDGDQEREVDQVLMTAGIRPGDPRLYGDAP